MRNPIRRYAAFGLFFLALFHLLWAQQSGYISTNYRKHEFRIPMRDGKKLFTSVYTPKDTSHSYPILLNRTPYGIAPYGDDHYPLSFNLSENLTRDGFIFVFQDVRGRMMSEGQFINMTPHNIQKKGPRDIDESSDAYDTIEWLVRNIPNNNGKVGMWGISYPGFYAASGMIDAHPALKAVSPQAPIADWFIGDDFHHNGGFYLAHAFGFLTSFGYPRPEPTRDIPAAFKFPTSDGYDFYLKMGPLTEANEKYLKNKIPFWNDLMRHGDYDDFWQARNLRPHLKNIRPAVMTVGGWFDAEDLFGTLNVYRSVESSSPGTQNILVMGPWNHGGWSLTDGEFLGSIRFGSETSVFYRNEIEAPFFKHFLKGEGKLNLPEAYFRADGKLSWDPDSADAADAYDEYISDPAKPVPYTNGIATGMMREYMVEDQRFASRRTDVLTYATDELDRDVTIAGPIASSLNVSTTGTDSDFVVKLIDAYPDDSPDSEPNPENIRMSGYQQLVRGEVFRGKYRNSFSSPEPFIPGKVARIEYGMPDVFHTFRKGHRIMVQVQSSWFPLVDRNPQKFVDIYQAKASDFIKATQRVFRSRSTPSFVTLQQIQ
jgi:predicted acyl esterase